MADLPKLDVVIANNFGHLPMFIGAEKGFFKAHGVDASFRVVDTGTDMVNALHNGEAQVGDMSTTTYLKAVHAGNPFQVIGLIMNDATNDRCDTPLAIVTRKGTGINVGKIGDLRGKKVGLAKGQTSDEYFKMVVRRAGVKYADVTIENIWSQFGLAPALKEGKVDAIVDLGALRHAGAHAGAGFIRSYPRRPAYVLRHGRRGSRADGRHQACGDQEHRGGDWRSLRISPGIIPMRRWRSSRSGCRAPTLPSARRRSAISTSIRACRRRCCALSKMPRTKSW